MQILGKIQLQGTEKELFLKEEDGLFKYYNLEWICSYKPDSEKNKVTLDANILTKQNILEILKLSKSIDEKLFIQIIGKIVIKNEYSRHQVSKNDLHYKITFIYQMKNSFLTYSNPSYEVY